MARLKQFVDGQPFTAQDATDLQLEVPPAATTASKVQVLSITDLTNFAQVPSVDLPSVGRQGLQCVLSGVVRVKTANWVGTGFRTVVQLPEEFRPSNQILAPGMTSLTHIPIIVINTDGTVQIRLNGVNSHAANMDVYFNVSYLVEG